MAQGGGMGGGCLLAIGAVMVLGIVGAVSNGGSSSRDVSATSSSPPREIIPRWRRYATTSALDGSAEIQLSVQSLETVTRGRRELGRATLYARCRENTTNLFVAMPDGVFLSVSDVPVSYSIDQGAVRSGRWNTSTDFGAFGLWSGGQAIPVIRQMDAGTVMTFRVTPYGEAPLDLQFSLIGFSNALPELREACNW